MIPTDRSHTKGHVALCSLERIGNFSPEESQNPAYGATTWDVGCHCPDTTYWFLCVGVVENSSFERKYLCLMMIENWFSELEWARGSRVE